MTRRFRNSRELLDFVGDSSWTEVEKAARRYNLTTSSNTRNVSSRIQYSSPPLVNIITDTQTNLYFNPNTLPPLPVVKSPEVTQKSILNKSKLKNNFQGVEI